jgi:acyl-CoA dehydrogenase
MAWDFSTEPEFQAKLDWIDRFVREEIEPLDLLWPDQHLSPLTAEQRKMIDPLKQQVKDRQLWACHLGPELGGQGYGTLKLALINEILGRTWWAPTIFGTQAPDTGNAEILAHYGTPDQKAKYLQPLLEGEIFSCFSMTEPQAGADPRLFTTQAVRDGHSWVINGHKFFSSNARSAAFLIVMAVTDPDVSPYEGQSMFLVPTDTPGVTIVRDVGTMSEPVGHGNHALIHYDNVRVPADSLLGAEGKGFEVAQTRLGGGRIHHAMRTVGLCRRAFEMLCERVLSRETQGSLLADKQMIQNYIADSYMQIEQYRLFVVYTAWLVDQKTTRGARKEIAMVKALMPQVLQDVVGRAMQVHGALGVSNEMPLGRMWMWAPVTAIFDGPTEVHKVTIARQVLRGYHPAPGMWPTEHLPAKIEAAKAKLAAVSDTEVGT